MTISFPETKSNEIVIDSKTGKITVTGEESAITIKCKTMEINAKDFLKLKSDKVTINETSLEIS